MASYRLGSRQRFCSCHQLLPPRPPPPSRPPPSVAGSFHVGRFVATADYTPSADLSWPASGFEPATSSSRGPLAAAKLIQDMRLSLNKPPEAYMSSSCTASELRVFAAAAKAALAESSFDDNVQIFYWLSKCAQGGGYELEDDLLLAYTNYIRSQSLLGSELRLVRVLRTLISVLNRNKLQSALETDVQLQMETVAHELLRAALPRLSVRHRHLTAAELSTLLSVYAKMFRPEYAELFESVASTVEERAEWAAVNEFRRIDFLTYMPFVLVAYAQARCVHHGVFDVCLQHIEAGIHELTYESVAVTAYAVARAGLNRPRLWRLISEQICSSGCGWSVQAVGRVVAACRKLLSPGGALLMRSPLQKGGDAVEALLEMLQLAGRQMLARSDQVTIHEATDIVMVQAAMPDELAYQCEPLALLSCACHVIQRHAADMPPVFLACAFYGLTAVHLEQGGMGEGQRGEVFAALQAVALQLCQRLCLCLHPEMELMAQALWALTTRAPVVALGELGVDGLLLVQQREVVRKARDFGVAGAARFSRLTAATAAVAASSGQGWVPLPSRGELLRPWFLPQMLELVRLDPTANAADNDAAGEVLLLQSLADSLGSAEGGAEMAAVAFASVPAEPEAPPWQSAAARLYARFQPAAAQT